MSRHLVGLPLAVPPKKDRDQVTELWMHLSADKKNILGSFYAEAPKTTAAPRFFYLPDPSYSFRANWKEITAAITPAWDPTKDQKQTFGFTAALANGTQTLNKKGWVLVWLRGPLKAHGATHNQVFFSAGAYPSALQAPTRPGTQVPITISPSTVATAVLPLSDINGTVEKEEISDNRYFFLQDTVSGSTYLPGSTDWSMADGWVEYRDVQKDADAFLVKSVISSGSQDTGAVLAQIADWTYVIDTTGANKKARMWSGFVRYYNNGAWTDLP